MEKRRQKTSAGSCWWRKRQRRDEPSAEDMFEMGCVATILQMLKLPDGTVKVLVEGVQRAKVLSITEGRHILPLSHPSTQRPREPRSSFRRARSLASCGDAAI
ncbi:MAG: LON peptidase substrate-binding domain-containing protein [Burkholderiaceae bacterium]